MGKKTKVGKTRRDKYYKLAKEAGYRSRAAFKLIQLNKKYDFLGSSRVLIDLCAAPGGWLQVASKYMPISSVIIGVDLVPIKPIHNVICLTEDITTDKCRAAIRKETKGWKVDCVLHDGAPNVGTSWTQDAYTQSALVLMALKIACEHLGNNGWFITKVFRSSDYNALMWVFQQLFTKVHATKPQASRNESAEIFVVCQGYLNPDKIDPKLFDPRAVFSEVELPANPVDILHQKPGKKAKAVGYPDGDMTFNKSLSASTFILSDEPIALLTAASKIVFDDSPGTDSKTGKPLPSIYFTHKETTDEIKACCQDIKVLGKTEVKALLKWRLLMKEFTEEIEKLQRKANSSKSKKSANDSNDEEEDSDEEGDDDDDDDDDDEQDSADEQAAMDLEMDDLERQALAERKKLRRKAYKKRVRMRERLNLKMDLPDDTFDIAKDGSLFALTDIKSGAALAKIAEAKLSSLDHNPDLLSAATENHDIMLGKSKRNVLENGGGLDFDDDDVDDDDEAVGEKNRTSIMEKYLDKMYENYKAKKGSKVPKIKKGKKVKKVKGDEEGEENIEEDDEDEDLDEDERREKELSKLYKSRVVPDVTTAVADLPEVVHADDVGDDSDDSDDEDSEEEEEDDDDEDDDSSDDEDDEDDGEGYERYKPPKSLASSNGTTSNGKNNSKNNSKNTTVQKNPLLLDLEDNLSTAKKTKLWFSDSLFKKNDDEDDDDLEIKRLKQLAKQQERSQQKKRKFNDDSDDDSDEEDTKPRWSKNTESEDDDDDFSGDSELDEDEEDVEEAKPEVNNKNNKSNNNKSNGKQKQKPVQGSNINKQTAKSPKGRNKKSNAINEADKDGFEIVPVDNSNSADNNGGNNSDDDDDDDEDKKEMKARLARLKRVSLGPEGLALGSMMLSKAKKRDLIDASYHRYAFNEKNLPSWFVEEESQHNVPTLPITKEMMREYRQKMKEINSRPIKKELEAKGRKRIRLERSLDRAKQKAQAISEAPDLTEAQKAKQIQKLMKQGGKAGEKKDNVKYIVSRRNTGKPRGIKGKYKLVDGRLKKDKRAAKQKARREKARRR